MRSMLIHRVTIKYRICRQILYFIVEESYYQSQGKRHSSPHLFLLTEQDDGIALSSYEIRKERIRIHFPMKQ